MNEAEMANQAVDALVQTARDATEILREEAELREVKRYFGIVLNLLIIMWVFILVPLPIAFNVVGYESLGIPGALMATGILPVIFLRPGIESVPGLVVAHREFKRFDWSFRWVGIVSACTAFFVFPLMIAGQIFSASVCNGMIIGSALTNSFIVFTFRKKVLRNLLGF